MQEGPAKALREKSSGLVRTIADWAYDTSIREYDELAIAVALAVIATCAQGTYLTPDNRSLSLYQLCLLPAAGGKDHYLRCIIDTLRAVDSRLVSANPGSSHGLRGELFCWNSRIWAADEVQDLLAKLTSTDNVFVGQLLSDLKELANGLERMPGQALKTQIVPDIIAPRLTFIGFGTPGRFREVITSNNVGGGLLSRFVLWQNETPPHRQRRSKAPLDPDVVGRLRAVAALGRTEHGQGGQQAFADLLKAYHEGKTALHLPQCSPISRLTISEGAQEQFDSFDHVCEGLYLQDPDSAEAAIHDRASTNAMRLASLHCIGCGRTEVNISDMDWACDVAASQGGVLSNLARCWMADSPQERDRQRVLNSLRSTGGKNSRRELAKNLRMGTRTIDGVLGDLQARGELQVTGPNGSPAEMRAGSFHASSMVALPH